MVKLKWRVLVFLVVAGSIVWPISGCSPAGHPPPTPREAPETIHISDPLRQELSAAQINFHRQIYTIMLSEAPEFIELLEIARDLQIAYIHRSDTRYEYLWHNHPQQIPTDGGHVDWVNFRWTDPDEQALSAASPAYVKLQQRISDLEKLNQGHPMWPPLRAKFKEMQQDPRMKANHKNLRKVLPHIDQELKSRSPTPPDGSQ